MDILKTKDYELFKFVDYNRAIIRPIRVKELRSSIKAKNLLHLRPICVNNNMEIVDGQHRFLVAKELGLEIYYYIDKAFEPIDMIAMNNAASWKAVDYLNFFVKQGYDEYVKLNDFMLQNNISIRIALQLTTGYGLKKFADFKNGKFKMPDIIIKEQSDICWKTIEVIKEINGYSEYTNSGRFWKALIILVKHPSFDKEKWFFRIEQMSSKMKAQATIKDYLHLFRQIYNWKNPEKIEDLNEGSL